MKKSLEQLEFENSMLKYRLRASEDRAAIAERFIIVLYDLKMTYCYFKDVRSRVSYFLLSLAIIKLTNKI